MKPQRYQQLQPLVEFDEDPQMYSHDQAFMAN